jgi:copper resistance protein B
MKGVFAVVTAIGAMALTRPAAAMDAADKTPLFYVMRAEVHGTKIDREGLVTWDLSGWVGRDRDKAWLRSEGEARGGDVEEAELWGLYSRNIATFWDAQIGVRQDFEPRGTTYAVIGVNGLSRYFFETDAHLFVSHRGDVSARIEQTFDLLITQRLIAQPHLELNFSAQDVPELGLGAGLNTIEAGVQIRYEIIRKFAPYVDFNYARATGETAGLRRAVGEDPEELTVRGGLRFWL